MGGFLGRARDKVSLFSLLLGKRALLSLRGSAMASIGKNVVFVAGVQRSGTNMMMSVLERSFETDVFHERDPRAFQDYEMRSREVIHRLVDGSKAGHVVIKALCELQDLKSLLDDFAPAKTLWLVRDYGDMINSHMRKWSGCPATIGKILDDPDTTDWRGRGMPQKIREVVAEHYHPDMTDASAVALFWCFRNLLFFEQGFDVDERVLPVRYESLVSEPHTFFPQALEFLGIPASDRIAAKVFARSINKDPKPEIEAPVRNLCEMVMSRFDALLGERPGS